MRQVLRSVSTFTLLICTALPPGLRAQEEAPEFQGKIAKKYEDSVEWWPKSPRPPEGAPNVLILLLDDVGFAQLSRTFGGLIDTPNIDRLAENGLRYNNFHTTALCSPSRATLMAGRNPHSIGLGSHALTAMGFPGYNATVPPTAKSVANYLQQSGYVNYALGKWDHTPLYEVSQAGPFHRWPSGEGFDHSYCFMAADVHQFIPVMWNDHTPEEYRKSEHLDKDLADRAIQWITGHKTLKPEDPFMMLWASGSMHSPHHAPDEYIIRYRGKFDMGWDKVREKIHAKQLEVGIIPAGTKLTERIDEIPAWDSLKPTEQQLYARQMEVFAAQMEHVDFQIGRILDTLKRLNGVNNVLFGDQKEYIYYAPGAVRIAEKASAPVKGRSHKIETTIDLKGGEEGVIMACGGMTGGYCMFIKGGRLYFDYNFLDGVYYTLESPPLPEGTTDFKFNFTATKAFGGKGELYLNGKKVDGVEMPNMHRSTYSLAETFDIGVDTGTQVSKLYKGTNKFTGVLDRVIITLTD